MRIVIVKKEESIADESSKAIEQECKRCGKKFMNMPWQMISVF